MARPSDFHVHLYFDPDQVDLARDHIEHVIWFGPSEPLATALFATNTFTRKELP